MAAEMSNIHEQIYTIFDDVRTVRQQVADEKRCAEDELLAAQAEMRSEIGMAVLRTLSIGNQVDAAELEAFELPVRGLERKRTYLDYAVNQLPVYAKRANERLDALLAGRLIIAGPADDAESRIFGLKQRTGVSSPDGPCDPKTGLYIGSDTARGNLYIAHETDPESSWEVHLYRIRGGAQAQFAVQETPAAS